MFNNDMEVVRLLGMNIKTCIVKFKVNIRR